MPQIFRVDTKVPSEQSVNVTNVFYGTQGEAMKVARETYPYLSRESTVTVLSFTFEKPNAMAIASMMNDVWNDKNSTVVHQYSGLGKSKDA